MTTIATDKQVQQHQAAGRKEASKVKKRDRIQASKDGVQRPDGTYSRRPLSIRKEEARLKYRKLTRQELAQDGEIATLDAEIMALRKIQEDLPTPTDAQVQKYKDANERKATAAAFRKIQKAMQTNPEMAEELSAQLKGLLAA